jgi:hypothetical protein
MKEKNDNQLIISKINNENKIKVTSPPDRKAKLVSNRYQEEYLGTQ